MIAYAGGDRHKHFGVGALVEKRAPARVVSMVLTGDIVPCYDYRILCEYREVLQRPKFGFSKSEINSRAGLV